MTTSCETTNPTETSAANPTTTTTTTATCQPSTSSSKCEMCAQNEFKYKCPRCLIKTCSLACCKQHKLERNCNGERDKTKFVDKEEFDEKLLLSDYRFLEEQSRLVENFQRTLEQATKPPESSEGLKPFHSGVYDQLRKFVYRNFGIRLQIMPTQSTRHLFNRTRFNRHQGLVSWSIEFAFHLQPKPVRFHSKNFIFSSKSCLNQVLSNFYNKFKSDFTHNRELDQKYTHVLETADFQQKLSILYEIADFRAKKRYFVKLDMDKTLESNLLNKTVIEYPTLFVVRNDDLAQFEIHDAATLNEAGDDNDHEEEEKVENGDQNEKDDDGEEDDEEEEDGEGKLIHSDNDEKPQENNQNATSSHKKRICEAEQFDRNSKKLKEEKEEERDEEEEEEEEGEEGELEDGEI